MCGADGRSQRGWQEYRHKPDAIAMGSHFIDCHHVQRLALSPTEFINEGRIWRLHVPGGGAPTYKGKIGSPKQK